MRGSHLRFVQKVGGTAATLVGHDSFVVRAGRPFYEFALRVLSFDRGIPWDINGSSFRVDPRFRHMLAHDYDAEVADFIRKRVRPGSVCFDVGANIGVYVLQLARWSGSTGRVVAFEPNPEAAQILRRHVSLNGIDGQVTVVPRAVGSRPGFLPFFSVGAEGMSRLGAPNAALEAFAVQSTVEVITLDDYVESTGTAPDWLIIDVEGFEFEALAGAKRLIGKRGARTNIVVEFHPQVWSSSGTSAEFARALLADLQLRPLPLTGQTDVWREYGMVYLERV